jgi:hypothetical protein
MMDKAQSVALERATATVQEFLEDGDAAQAFTLAAELTTELNIGHDSPEMWMLRGIAAVHAGLDAEVEASKLWLKKCNHPEVRKMLARIELAYCEQALESDDATNATAHANAAGLLLAREIDYANDERWQLELCNARLAYMWREYDEAMEIHARLDRTDDPRRQALNAFYHLKVAVMAERDRSEIDVIYKALCTFANPEKDAQLLARARKIHSRWHGRKACQHDDRLR